MTEIDLDDEDNEEFDELFEDDDWEDSVFEKTMKEKYPGWYLIKLSGFTARTFETVKEWLQDDNVHFGSYETLGFHSECSYSVGVAFQSGKDAMIFKLRFR